MLPYRSEVNSIDFESIRLIGRETESARLEAAYESICASSSTGSDSDNRNSDCLLITGKSGSGKTRLVTTFRSTVVYSGGNYAGGKFDQLSSTRPYSALVDAIGDLFHNLAMDAQVKSEIVRHLESDLPILYSLVPSVRAAMHSEIDGTAAGSRNNNQENRPEESISQWMFVRLKTMICKLFRAMSKIGPFVLFLDDLQWCDSSSIELINSVIADEKITNFLFIGAYRDDEVAEDDHHELSKMYRFNDESCIIHVNDLSEQNVNKLVADALRLEVFFTQPLSEEIYRKTAGNCFFVVHFLKLLEKNKLLVFSLSSYQWTWDLPRIVTEMESTDNVAEIVAKKLQNLPPESQTALAVAACFGNKFVGEVLVRVLKALNPESIDSCISSRNLMSLLSVQNFTSDVDEVLAAAIEEGIVATIQNNVDGSDMIVYKFGHDKIQSAAYDLVASKDRFQLHALMGKILWKMLPDAASVDEHETLLVKIVEQLHRAGPRITKESFEFRVDVARLNLEAARSVQRNAAFLTAAEYLRSSTLLLGDSRWSKYYQLTLEILNLQAEMEFCCGRYLYCKQAVSAILANATCIEDKLHAYIVWADCLGSQKKTDEIMETVYHVVAQLGFHTPRQKAGLHHVVRQYIKAKRAVKHCSNEDLLSYRKCDDRSIEGCLKLLSRTMTIAWMADSTNDVAYISMLMFYISLTKGFTKYSANSFVAFGVVLAKRGDINAGRRFGKLALDICDRFQAKECDGQTILLYYSFIHHTSNPMPELLDHLIEANRLAKAGGDIEHSHHAFSVYIFTYIVCGLPLSVVENDAKLFIDEMKQYKRTAALTHSRLYRQLALNLIYRPADPFRMEGEEIPHLQALLMKGNEIDNKRTREGVMNCQLYLACYLGRGKAAKRLVMQHAKLKDPEYPMCYSTVFPYLRGVIFLRLAREGCRGSKRRASKEIKRIRSFVRMGFVNSTHLLHILEAGMLSVSNHADHIVRAAFDKAIAQASRSGFPHDAGLASEHAAIHFRHRDESWYDFYLERSIECYHQWGAKSKIEMMAEHRNSSCISQSASGDGTTVSSAIRGRSRRNSIHRNCDHETTDWFSNNSASNSSVRRNLSISSRRGIPL